MIALAPAFLILTLSALGLPPVSLIDRALPCYALPANIRVSPDLRRVIVPLLARSPTLRTQCTKIAAAPRTFISIDFSVGPFPASARARSTAHRYLSGLLMVNIELPPASLDFGELLAHELEHVTEFIEQIDFKTLARSRDSGIVQCDIAGNFESIRAQRAGKTAAAEIGPRRP